LLSAKGKREKRGVFVPALAGEEKDQLPYKVLATTTFRPQGGGGREEGKTRS